jgi:hypothetical protein
MEAFKLDRSEDHRAMIRMMEWSLREMKAGGPCVGCGYCCIKSPCNTFMTHSTHTFTKWRGCPGFRWDGTRHWCGLMLKDEKLKEQEHVGKGCCSSLNSWRRGPLQDRR